MQEQPTDIPTKSLRALKQLAHQLVESQVTLQLERDTLKEKCDKFAFQQQELNAVRDALEAECKILKTQLQELTTQKGILQLDRDSIRSERDVLYKQQQEKILIRSALKHGLGELRGIFKHSLDITRPRSEQPGKQSRPRLLAKVIGTSQNIDKNNSYQFAASHAICHYESNTVCTYIPKNACTSLRYSIAAANGAIGGADDFPWIHLNNESFRASRAEIIKAGYTFVILRNPFARLVSFFLDKLACDSSNEHDSSPKTAKKQFPISDEELTFRSFVDHLWNHPEKLILNHHVRPQVDFLLYEDYDDWFCVERIDEATSRIKERAGFLLHDTRSLSGHTSFSLETVSTGGLSDLNILQIRDLRSRGQRPCPLAIYDESTAFRVHAMFASDVMLYNWKFEEQDEMHEWLRLSNRNLCGYPAIAT